MMEDLMRQLGDVKKDVDSAMKKLGKQKDGADKKDVDDLKLQVKELQDENKQLKQELSRTVKLFVLFGFDVN